MTLLSGENAVQAVKRLVESTDGVLALEIDPAARDGEELQILAVANTTSAVILDAQRTPMSDLFDVDAPLAAHDAKAVHHALNTRDAAGPDRWACLEIIETLLSGGRHADTSLSGIAERLQQPPPPPPDAGLKELGSRAVASATLLQHQVADLKQHGMSWTSRIEARAIAAIADMEQNGMPFDAAAWAGLSRDAERDRESARSEVLGLFASGPKDLLGDTAVNIDSDQALKQALHGLGFNVPNVRRSTLRALPDHVASPLVRYRELGKLVTTYGESFLTHVASDGRIHPTFEQMGASTGRMACHNPNLQAMVKSGPHRACFRCDDSRRLVVSDYATCELRILAEMSGDPVFAEAFARGADLHSQVASSLFHKPVSKTENAELRERAKAVNFGLVYGMGAGGLARAIDAPLHTAQDLLNSYFRTFPRIKDFLETTSADALKRGFAHTMTGRRLYLDPGADDNSRAQAERIAKNMPIQGTSADITKLALGKLRTALRKFSDAWLVNAVHDEVVVECDADEAEPVADAVREAMEGAGAEVLRTIPLTVDTQVGQIWTK